MQVDEFEIYIDDRKDSNHIFPHTHFIKHLPKKIELHPGKKWWVGVKFLQIVGEIQEQCLGIIHLPNLIEDPYEADYFTVFKNRPQIHHAPEWLKYFPVTRSYFSDVEVLIQNYTTKQVLCKSQEDPNQLSNQLSHTVLILKFKHMHSKEYVYHFNSKNAQFPSNTPNQFRVLVPQDLKLHPRQSWKMCLIMLKWPSAALTSPDDMENNFQMQLYYNDPVDFNEKKKAPQDPIEISLGDRYEAAEADDYDFRNYHEEEEEDSVDFLNSPTKEWIFTLDANLSTEQVVRILNEKLNEVANNPNDEKERQASFHIGEGGRIAYSTKNTILFINTALARVLGGEEAGPLLDNYSKVNDENQFDPLKHNVFPKHLDLRRNLPTSILVRCNIIRDADGEDKLALIPITNSIQLQHETKHPNFVDIDVSRISNMQFTLCRLGGEPIVFASNNPCILSVQIKQF